MNIVNLDIHPVPACSQTMSHMVVGVAWCSVGRDVGAERCPWMGQGHLQCICPGHFLSGTAPAASPRFSASPSHPDAPGGAAEPPLAGLPQGSRVSFDFGVSACKRADPTEDQA